MPRMRGHGLVRDVLFVAFVAALQAHPSAVARSSRNTTCFDVELYDRLGNGWNGANYSISTVDDGRNVIVAGGTLEDGFNRTDEICVALNTCYTMNVSAPTPRWRRFGIYWLLADGTLSGSAPDHADFFVSADDGEIFPGCTAPTAPPSSSQKMTLMPTASSSPRTLFATASCFKPHCVAYATFDTAAFANFIVLAELTIDVDGNFRRGSSTKSAKIAINDDVVGSCGEARCTKSRCSSFNGTDVTAAARTGTLAISFTVSPDIVLSCGIIGNDSPLYFLQADAWLYVELSETTSPTAAPTTTSPPSSLAAYSPRTLVAAESCFTASCEFNLTLDTSTFAGFVEAAKLTIALSGNFGSPHRFAEIAVDGEEFGNCGKLFFDWGSVVVHDDKEDDYENDDDAAGLFCVKSTICPNFNGIDVTVGARAGTVIITISVSDLVFPICGFDKHAVKARATLVVDLSDTRYPTALPTTSQRPTALIDSSPRTLVATVTGGAETVYATFDTSAFAGSIAAAEMTVNMAGVFGLTHTYVDIAVNGDDLGTCGDELGYFLHCQRKQRCANFNGTDITTAARTGMVVTAFTANFFLGESVCYDGISTYSYQAEVILVIDFSESSFPTPFPTTASPTESPTAFPTVSIIPDATVATFQELQAAIQEVPTASITVRGHITFKSRLDLVSVHNLQINGSGSDFAVFDGGFNTSLFRLENTTLTLEAITLVNCWAKVGGCVQATTSSLFLVSVSVVNCRANYYGGGFRLESHSLLQAVNSTFDSNNATQGGVVSLVASSRFEAVASYFTANSARVGGVATLHASSFISTGSSFQGNRAQSRAGVAWITETSNFTAMLSFFEANQGGNLGGGVIHSDAASSFSATNSHFWMNSAFLTGGVAWIEDKSTFAVTRSSFYGNSVAFFGGAVYALSSSTFMATESSFRNNTAIGFGGVVTLKGSTFTARNSSFEENGVKGYGGVVIGLNRSTVTVTDSSFASNQAGTLGGVALLNGSTWTSTNCSYEKNHAVGSGGCFYVGTSVVTVAYSSFKHNSATRAGVVDGEVHSTFAATNSIFNSNSALIRGGITYMYDGSTFTATNSSFLTNHAALGGCAYIDAYSKFSVRNSSFTANRAFKNGSLVLFTKAATIELYNSTIQGHKRKSSSMIDCIGSGIAYAALLTIELSERINLDANCVLLLYQLNNNGTEAFRDAVIENGVVDPSTAAVSFVQWSYPCEQGQWSPDGIEHGDTGLYLDGNGYTINENDPFCTSGSLRRSERCSDSCVTCPAGTYLEFTLDRYAHVREESCAECPAGTFLEDATQRWWFHDERDDCIKCPPGRFANKPRSARCDVCQSGTYSTEPGSTLCAFTDPGYFIVDAASQPEKCPPGSFSVGGQDSCQACNVGYFQPKSGQTQCLAAEPGHFVDVGGADNSWPCPPGQYSLSQAHSCSNCSNGTFASGFASTSCVPASPGHYVPVEGTAGETPCDPGRFSSDSGERTCTECEVGTYQPESGQPACVPAEPGYFVKKSGATEQQPCAAGRFSLGATGICEFCPPGEFQPDTGHASCIACPSPMKTTGLGRRYCDACIQSYFWNSLHWENNFDQELVNNGTQCVDCCVRCEVVCNAHDEDSCVSCDEDGSELATLDVNRGWWRATPESMTVYECRLDHACRGGRSTLLSEQCFDGHFGCVFCLCHFFCFHITSNTRSALCGACKEGYEHDIARNRCVRCASWLELLRWPGNICVICVLTIIALSYCQPRMSKWVRCCIQTAVDTNQVEEFGMTVFSEPQRSQNNDAAGVPAGEDQRSQSNDATVVPAGEGQRSRNNDANGTLAGQDQRSQGNDATGARAGEVHRSQNNDATAHAEGDQPSQNNNAAPAREQQEQSEKFRKSVVAKLLLFITLAPFGAIFLVGSLYCCYKYHRGNFKQSEVKANIMYGTLFFIYVVLPSISQYVITYFSCARFDRGNSRYLRVIAAELSIKCTSKRYRGIFFTGYTGYCGLMIAIYPCGVTLAIFAALYSNRESLNWPIPPQAVETQTIEADFKKFYRREYSALEQVTKLEKRKERQEMDNSRIKYLEFLFEDYKPRSFLFPVFEILSRLFLSSIVAVFYPGSMQQVVVALIGAVFSLTVYSSCEPFIEENDDCVAALAQLELVLIYIGALGVYISDTTDQATDFFTGDIFDFLMVALIFLTFIASVRLILLENFGSDSLLGCQAQCTAQQVGDHQAVCGANSDVGSSTSQGQVQAQNGRGLSEPFLPSAESKSKDAKNAEHTAELV